MPAKSASQRRRARAVTKTLSAEMQRRDRRWFTVALIVPLAALIPAALLTGPGYGGLTLIACVLLATAAGRALLPSDPPAPRPEPASRWYFRGAAALVFVAALLPYLPTLTLGFLSDDYNLLTSVTPRPRVLSALAFNPQYQMYRGLHFAAWWVEGRLWGHAALGYHAVNLLFHGLSAVLVWALCRRLTGSKTAALLAGLLFAVHPLHVETVAWASDQVDLQTTMLCLLSLLLVDVWLCSPSPRLRPLALVGAGFTFLLALLTKESSLALPGVVVLWALLRADRRRAVLGGAVFGLVLGAYLAVRYSVFGGMGGYYQILDPWRAWFPASPLRMVYAFFFPLVTGLFGTTFRGAAYVALGVTMVAMAALLVACARGCAAVPGRRLAFYLGVTGLLSIPVWHLPVTGDLEGARFGYLPTIGLVWLCAEVGAAALRTRARGRLIPVAALLASTVLCVWYLLPWRLAQRLSTQTVQSAVRVIQRTPRSGRAPTFFFQNLPDNLLGAQVCRNGFGFAVREALGRPVLVQTVGTMADLPREALMLSTLQPGEYVYEWNDRRKTMVLVRDGTRESPGGAP